MVCGHNHSLFSSPLIEPDGRISRIRLSEAVLRFASFVSPCGVRGKTSQAVLLMQAFVPILRPVMRPALGVFLPQPSPDSMTHLPLHLPKHLVPLRVVKGPDPAAYPLIDPGHYCFRLFPERVPFRFFAYCRQ